MRCNFYVSFLQWDEFSAAINSWWKLSRIFRSALWIRVAAQQILWIWYFLGSSFDGAPKICNAPFLGRYALILVLYFSLAYSIRKEPWLWSYSRLSEKKVWRRVRELQLKPSVSDSLNLVTGWMDNRFYPEIGSENWFALPEVYSDAMAESISWPRIQISAVADICACFTVANLSFAQH